MRQTWLKHAGLTALPSLLVVLVVHWAGPVAPVAAALDLPAPPVAWGGAFSPAAAVVAGVALAGCSALLWRQWRRG